MNKRRAFEEAGLWFVHMYSADDVEVLPHTAETPLPCRRDAWTRRYELDYLEPAAQRETAAQAAVQGAHV